ncbi:nicotinate phosphoribosyltransferase [Compostibacter hankyongensis]|uniref:Nicotinate phosphoribosyltransferase n=1 Tax=Compostibacter hankyongensis TaxID=1007089 RepID=A0ABP8G9Q8_9BACT
MRIPDTPPVIQSLLDNDFYKFTMQHAVVKLFPRAKAHYRFINRGNHRFPDHFSVVLRQELDRMAELRLTGEEKQYLALTCPYLDPTYLDFLQGFRYDPSEVTVRQTGGELDVSISGYWYRTILWEVPVMALISELYYRVSGLQRNSDEQVAAVTRSKIEHYRQLGVKIAEFGTRRRHSYAVHRLVVETLKQYGEGSFTGTSNVHLAFRSGVKPIGTHAHEWFMFHAAGYGFKMSNRMALEHWVEVYRGDLGIALSDTYTTPVFFAAFDKKFSKLFDGIRHDSGDPLVFAQAAIDHYRAFNIDPLSKTIIFSDGLDPQKVDRIAAFCRGKVGMSFGIGTNFTNDAGLPALNIVIKMVSAQPEDRHWIPVVKLSDEPGKYTGDPEMIALAKTVLQIS